MSQTEISAWFSKYWFSKKPNAERSYRNGRWLVGYYNKKGMPRIRLGRVSKLNGTGIKYIFTLVCHKEHTFVGLKTMICGPAERAVVGKPEAYFGQVNSLNGQMEEWLSSECSHCAGLILTLCALPAVAGEALSGGELRSLFPGRFQAVVSGFIHLKITARGNGSLSAISARGKDRPGALERSGRANYASSSTDGSSGRRSCTPVVQEAGWYSGSMVKFKRI